MMEWIAGVFQGLAAGGADRTSEQDLCKRYDQIKDFEQNAHYIQSHTSQIQDK